MPNPEIFISYRRQDSAYFSQWLAADLSNKFGEGIVFIDTQNIRDADIWKSKIEDQLSCARLLFVIIGDTWLSAVDENKRRRIDNRDDWVRREIEIGLRSNKIIFPVLINNAQELAVSALPSSLRELATRQARRIHDGDIRIQINDIGLKVAELLGKTILDNIPMPVPLLLGIVDPLDEENLRHLTERLPNWKVVQRQGSKGVKIELRREYFFVKFEDAIHFMNTAARFMSEYDHHAEWTNMWTTLTVYLTTWDIGSRPSMLDIVVAEYLDSLYKGYQQKFTKDETIKLAKQRAI